MTEDLNTTNGGHRRYWTLHKGPS